MARTRTTVSPGQKILSALASNKEYEQYKLPDKTGLSYRTILRTLKKLENRGLVRIVRTEPSEKGGKEKKIYSITFHGLWSYLALVKVETREGRLRLELAIGLFPEMLLFFKKWPLFVKANIHETLLDSFVVALQSSWLRHIDIARLIIIQQARKGTKQQFFEALKSDIPENLDSQVLAGALFIPGIRELYRSIIVEDRELETFVRKVLDHSEKELEEIRDLKHFLFK